MLEPPTNPLAFPFLPANTKMWRNRQDVITALRSIRDGADEALLCLDVSERTEECIAQASVALTEMIAGIIAARHLSDEIIDLGAKEGCGAVAKNSALASALFAASPESGNVMSPTFEKTCVCPTCGELVRTDQGFMPNVLTLDERVEVLATDSEHVLDTILSSMKKQCEGAKLALDAARKQGLL